MNDTERLEQGLKALREADAGRGASDFLETRLRAAFRDQHAAQPRRRFGWAWIGALATVAVAVLIVWRLSTPASIQAPPKVVVQTPAPTPPPVVASAPPAKPAPRRRTPPSKPRPVDSVTASTRENDFIALPYAPPFGPTDRGQVMRVRMPRQALRQLGLPMNEERIFERIPADVLLGEDGIPRAIRIVNSR